MIISKFILPIQFYKIKCDLFVYIMTLTLKSQNKLVSIFAKSFDHLVILFSFYKPYHVPKLRYIRETSEIKVLLLTKRCFLEIFLYNILKQERDQLLEQLNSALVEKEELLEKLNQLKSDDLTTQSSGNQV